MVTIIPCLVSRYSHTSKKAPEIRGFLLPVTQLRRVGQLTPVSLLIVYSVRPFSFIFFPKFVIVSVFNVEKKSGGGEGLIVEQGIIKG